MRFSYEDLISGDAIFVEGIGHLQSPQLRKLQPSKGIGFWTYNVYVGLFAWDKDNIRKFLRSVTGSALTPLNDGRLQAFDILTVVPISRDLLQKAISFFMTETAVWKDLKHQFEIVNGENEVVGFVNRDNFGEFSKMVLELNYVGLGGSSEPTGHSSKKSEELWKQAQSYLKTQNSKLPEDKTLSIANIISKLCATNTSYNLLNIYDLTVFQLYDQFFQYSFLRTAGLGEMIFSNHGGKDFDIKGWLEPLQIYKEKR